MLALFALLTTLLVDRAQLGRPTEEISLELSPEALAAGFREGVQWQGLYRDDEKVGFVRLQRRRTDDGYRLDQATVLRMADGTTAQVSVQTDLDPAFALQSFTASAEQPVSVRVRGTWVGDGLQIEAEGLPGLERQHLPMAEPPAFGFSLAPIAARSDLQPGDRFTFTHFDPMTLSSREGAVEMLGREPLDVLGERVSALHLRQEIAGQTLEVWVNELGEVLREQMPTGLVAVREPEAEATWGLAGPGASR